MPAVHQGLWELCSWCKDPQNSPDTTGMGWRSSVQQQAASVVHGGGPSPRAKCGWGRKQNSQTLLTSLIQLQLD